MSQSPIYKQTVLWAKEYGNSGISDQRAVSTFIECETSEAVRGLQNELMGISKGNYEDRALDLTIGPARRIKHGSYSEWAKMMLIWIAGSNKGA